MTTGDLDNIYVTVSEEARLGQVSSWVFKNGKVNLEHFFLMERFDFQVLQRKNILVLEIGTSFEKKQHDFFLQFLS